MARKRRDVQLPLFLAQQPKLVFSRRLAVQAPAANQGFLTTKAFIVNSEAQIP
jgi:hypothetical protein